MSEWLMQTGAGSGVGIRIAIGIADIKGDRSVINVHLNDGMLFSADIVVSSCGIQANIKLA